MAEIAHLSKVKLVLSLGVLGFLSAIVALVPSPAGSAFGFLDSPQNTWMKVVVLLGLVIGLVLGCAAMISAFRTGWKLGYLPGDGNLFWISGLGYRRINLKQGVTFVASSYPGLLEVHRPGRKAVYLSTALATEAQGEILRRLTALETEEHRTT